MAVPTSCILVVKLLSHSVSRNTRSSMVELCSCSAEAKKFDELGSSNTLVDSVRHQITLPERK